MEANQDLKSIPWISESIDVKEYFEEYHKTLDQTNGKKPHNQKFAFTKSMQDFFHRREKSDGDLSKSISPSSPSSLKSEGSLRGYQTKDDGIDEPFSVDFDQMEADCSIDLLTVEGELPPRELCEPDSFGNIGRIANWYTGAYTDGVIPDGASQKLATLASQARELNNREEVKDYIRLRHRLLKYSSTVRMILKEEKENSLEEVSLKDDLPGSCLRDTIFNIRICRPFHKRSFSRKGSCLFPKHSQEILMLGSQKLTELRDAIVCPNDYYVHTDMSENPDLTTLSTLPTSNRQFPSAFFYFKGTLFTDFRNSDAMDSSENIEKWAKKHPEEIGPITSENMSVTLLSDLKIRLGYPYVYQHLGNCEHLVVITDIRCVNRNDIQNPSSYPLSRVNPVKHVVKCFACNILLAKWIVKNAPRLHEPCAHFCHPCLKSFFYDENNTKIGDFNLFPFIDEIKAQTLKADKKTLNQPLPRSIEIKIEGKDAQYIIEPIVDMRSL